MSIFGGGMLDDLTKEIKAQLYERVKSPLFGAFAFSWMIWNYRVLLALVSDLKFPEKMQYIDKTYPTAWDLSLHGVLGPLVSAVLFLWLYPYPARWMYSYWATQQKKLKEVQQSIEDETPLTRDEARVLRGVALDQARDFESRLAGLQATNEELKVRIGILNEENARLDKELQQQIEAANRADGQLATVARGVLSPVERPSEGQSKASYSIRYSDAIDQLPIDDAEQIRSLGSEASMALIGLVACGGGAAIEKLEKALGANPISIRYGLKALVARKLVIEVNSDYFKLADAGDTLAVRLGLVSVVPRVDG